MAVDTLDAAFAGFRQTQFIYKGLTGTMVVGRPWSLWSLPGIPGPGSFDTTLNGVVLSSSSALVNGQIPHYDPATGVSRLARATLAGTTACTALIIDRLWHNGGFTITSTSAQSITSPTWPSRCPTSGTDDTPTTTGNGVLLAVEVSSTTGAGTPTITVSYTNSAGTSGRSATNVLATVASSATGSFYMLGLAAGDVGVRSVQSLTLSSTWTSGVINLVAYRVITSIEMGAANVASSLDLLTSGAPRLYNGAVPGIVIVPSATTTSSINGTFVETQG